MKKQIKNKKIKPLSSKEKSMMFKNITEKPKDSTSTYYLKMKLNDSFFETETNDLKSSILSFAPKTLKTKIVFTITKDGKVCDRQVFVQKGKMLFRSNLFLDTFIRMLTFK